jgi:hypothetical protein
MDVPVLPDPARLPAEPDVPLEPPQRAPILNVIPGGGEATSARGELRAVPDLADEGA